MPGKIRMDNAPWLKEPLDAWGDNSVRDVTVMCSAQSSKTTLAALGMCWSVAEDPGRALWVTADQDMAKEDLRDRFLPLFRACPPVRDSILLEQNSSVIFRTMPLYFTGANSPAKLQSKPVRWLVGDEVRNWPPNAVPTVLKRTRSYWNCRRVLLSTPGDKSDSIHRAYQQGDQRVYHVRCNRCLSLFPLQFERLKAEHPETAEAVAFRDVPGFVREDGTHDFNLLEPLIRYECPNCNALLKDEPQTRKALAREGCFVPTNPGAKAGRVSFHWNALLPWWVSWSSVVEEYFNALSALRTGDHEPMRTWVTETLGKPWEEDFATVDDYGFLEDRRGEYELGEVWADEAMRFMSADRQAKGGEHYWWVVRAFSNSGESRLVAHGKALTKEALEEKRKELNVPASRCAIDSGHSASDVYRFAIACGWKPFKGEDDQWFVTSQPTPGGKAQRIRRSWDVSQVDASMGKKGPRRLLKLYRWSNPRFFDVLASAMTGIVPGWTIPKKTESAYMAQIASWVRDEIRDALGRPKLVWRPRTSKAADHYRDCELQILVMASICRLIRAPQRISKGDVPPIGDDVAGAGPSVQSQGGGGRGSAPPNSDGDPPPSV